MISSRFVKVHYSTMDDPLIGLTIYDSTQSGSETEHPSETNDGSYDVAVDTDELTATIQSKKEWRVGMDSDGKECFPCLPGISEDLQNECVKSASLTHTGASVSDDASTNQSNQDENKIKSEHYNRSLAHPKNYWLMRLFQSNLFTMSIGISYLFNSKDPEVLSYLGGRLYVSC